MLIIDNTPEGGGARTGSGGTSHRGAGQTGAGQGADGPDGIDHAALQTQVEAVNTGAARLYKKREPIHPKLVFGAFRNLKWAAMVVLLGIYYITPWLRWDRGEGRVAQAVMVDFEGRRFYFGPIELWPHELTYIAGLLILAGLGIFLAAALFGRVWCGYACPQTVWTDLFIYVERFFEGDRNQRLRNQKAPLSAGLLARKVGKHVVWLAIALATGGAWVFYFGDAPTIFAQFFTGEAALSVYLFVGILTFTTYTLAGTMREQVCIYMCPWPRIQAAMTDQDALNVMYREARGEPRGPKKKTQSWDGRGDCIDCKACVAACPMGIDIRDGDQLECIQCALCVDACDDIMDKVGRPRGLIAYDTQTNAQHRGSGQAAKVNWLRPRVLLYGGVMALVAGVTLYGMLHRSTLDVAVVRDRSPAFVTLADGSVRNGYTLKILNLEPRDRALQVRVISSGPVAWHTSAGQEAIGGQLAITAPADTSSSLHVYVAAAPELARDMKAISFQVEDLSGRSAPRNVKSTFLSGRP